MVGFWSFIDRVLDETAVEFAGPATVAAKFGSGTGGKVTARLHGGDPSGDCVSRYQVAGTTETRVTSCLQPVVAMNTELSALVSTLGTREP